MVPCSGAAPTLKRVLAQLYLGDFKIYLPNPLLLKTLDQSLQYRLPYTPAVLDVDIIKTNAKSIALHWM